MKTFASLAVLALLNLVCAEELADIEDLKAQNTFAISIMRPPPVPAPDAPDGTMTNVNGLVRIEQMPGEDIRMHGEIRNLPPLSKHGFHVHEFGVQPGEPCLNTGGHYNPNGLSHGGPMDAHRHVGDLGNIDSDENGVARFDITDRMASLHNHQSIIGRSLVLHVTEDDLGTGGVPASEITGNAGGRISCGIIQSLGDYEKSLHKSTAVPSFEKVEQNTENLFLY